MIKKSLTKNKAASLEALFCVKGVVETETLKDMNDKDIDTIVNAINKFGYDTDGYTIIDALIYQMLDRQLGPYVSSRELLKDITPPHMQVRHNHIRSGFTGMNDRDLHEIIYDTYSSLLESYHENQAIFEKNKEYRVGD
ncbi:MAG: hypothetical protein ABSA11_15395 [Candidatus Bathyarchaeia archaeon]|jgi:hypothetical protein